jgi:glycosyltransferase involved in cell wall biosynthesis
MEAGSGMSLSGQNRISVAMCTYNGERFLSQQLATIGNQTRLPDELVVCDDQSTDQTVAIVREFAATVSYPVRVFENERTLGFAANFERAIRLCEGDLVALSDQDDAWYPQRLERSEQEFMAHPEAGLVFSDADVMDEQGRPLGGTLWRRLGFVGKRRQDLLAGKFGVLAKHRFVTGATVMLRATLRERYLPIGAGWIHDEWIALITAAFADLRPIDEPLIRYRIHSSQQVGLQNKLMQRAHGATRGEKHRNRLAESAKELQQICDALSAMVLDAQRDVLPAYRRHLQFLLFRSGLPESRWKRFVPVLRHYAGYEVHASGLPSVLKDLVL